MRKLVLVLVVSLAVSTSVCFAEEPDIRNMSCTDFTKIDQEDENRLTKPVVSLFKAAKPTDRKGNEVQFDRWIEMLRDICVLLSEDTEGTVGYASDEINALLRTVDINALDAETYNLEFEAFP